MKINDLRNTVAESYSEGFELFSMWFFGELAFTLLPIGIILAINLAFGESLNDILLLSDWSFGAIVLFGLAIGQLIEIKTKYQKDSSYRIYAGTRLFILCVIASSVVLALVILSHKSVNNINLYFLSVAQIFLFFLSAVSVFMSMQAKQQFLNSPRKSLKQANVKLLRAYFRYALEESEQNLQECHRIMQINSGKIFDATTPGETIDVTRDKERLILLVESVEKQVAQVKDELQNILAVSYEVQPN